MRDEDDESIYSYKDKYMRWFVRQSFKGGRVGVFNQCYKTKLCDEGLKILSKEINIKRSTYDTIAAYLNSKNKPFEFFDRNYDCNFNDYSYIDEENKEKYVNEKIIKLPIHQLMKQIYLFEFYGILMLLVDIQMQCGMKDRYVQKLKRGRFSLR